MPLSHNHDPLFKNVLHRPPQLSADCFTFFFPFINSTKSEFLLKINLKSCSDTISQLILLYLNTVLKLEINWTSITFGLRSVTLLIAAIGRRNAFPESCNLNRIHWKWHRCICGIAI